MSTLKHYSDSAMSAAGNFKIWDFGKDRYGNDFSPEYHDIWVIEEDGSMYKGFWKDGMKQGRGVQILTNKDYYDGASSGSRLTRALRLKTSHGMSSVGVRLLPMTVSFPSNGRTSSSRN